MHLASPHGIARNSASLARFAIAVALTCQVVGAGPAEFRADAETRSRLTLARRSLSLDTRSPDTLIVEVSKRRADAISDPGPSKVQLSLDGRCRIDDSTISHVLDGERFWQTRDVSVAVRERAKRNVTRRCAVYALAYALRPFAGFPMTARALPSQELHGISGLPIEFSGAGGAVIVLMLDPTLHRPIGLIEGFRKAPDAPLALMAVSRFTTYSKGPGIRHPATIAETSGGVILQLTVTTAQFGTHLAASQFTQP